MAVIPYNSRRMWKAAPTTTLGNAHPMSWNVNTFVFGSLLIVHQGHHHIAPHLFWKYLTSAQYTIRTASAARES